MSQMEAPVREAIWNPTARGQGMSVCNVPEPDRDRCTKDGSHISLLLYQTVTSVAVKFREMMTLLGLWRET